jgi:hypothetical protein
MKLDQINLRRVSITMISLTIAAASLLSLSCNSGQSNPLSAGTVKPTPTASVDVPLSTNTPLVTPGTASVTPVNVQHTPTSFYNPQLESFVPDSDTVVIGYVMESPPQFQEGEDIYRDWIFKVENYIVNPFPQESLKVRIWEQAGMMPVKGTHLSQGQHLLIFLKVEGDHFIIVGGLMGAKFIIDGDRVSYALIANSPHEQLTGVIARIETVADTWANEKLNDERRSELGTLVTGDPGINEFLAGKDYGIGEVLPSVTEDALTEIYYTVSINIPKSNQPDVQLVATVNVTQKKVDKIQVYPGYTEYSDEVKNQLQQIALADPGVQGLIGDRGYKIADIIRDSWQDNIEGKTAINIFPKVEIWLQPAISNILSVFVDLKVGQVVKIFDESYISPTPLESSASDRDFKLTVKIPKTDYQVGELAKAILTLSYDGDQPVELSSPSGQYFDLLIRDGQNNIVYQWERYNAGLSPSLPAPTEVVTPPPPLTVFPHNSIKTTIDPGQSITGTLEFNIPKAGTYYFGGRNFGGWDFGEILAEYPSGNGYGLYIEATFIVIEVH